MPAAKENGAERILDVAQSHIQRFGYNGFSFRDVAAEVGMKSASVHYHFPTKADLGVAVVKRYHEQFAAALGGASDSALSVEELLARFANVYLAVLNADQLMCLCGMLGAEVAALPEDVATEVKNFFSYSIDWLTIVYERKDQSNGKSETMAPRIKAQRHLATMQGALILARSMRDPKVFNEIANAI